MAAAKKKTTPKPVKKPVPPFKPSAPYASLLAEIVAEFGGEVIPFADRFHYVWKGNAIVIKVGDSDLQTKRARALIKKQVRIGLERFN